METSSISFFDSSSPPPQAAANNANAVSLVLLSADLERLLDPEFHGRADVEIILAAEGGEPGGTVVAAYSCFLAARSPFFRRHITSLPAGEKPSRLELTDLVPGGCHIGREALVAVLGYMYTGRFQVPPQECVDEACRHGACRPAIAFVAECMYASSGFEIPELVSLCQRRLFEFVDIAVDEDIIPIIHVASTCQLSYLLNQCIQRIATSTLNKYLEKQVAGDDIDSKIKEFYRCSFVDELLDNDDSILTDRQRTVRNIHKALDSDDVDLVRRLLKESAVTLDDAFAVHYAAAYCKPEVLTKLLKLDSANLNWKNSSGYTPLHMACMRQEPDIILPLVKRGASVMEKTPDERDSHTICKRLTRKKDYNKKLEKCQERGKAYLCIDILEQELKRKSFALHTTSEEETNVTHLLDNERLKNLEFRVECAKLIFPSEAMLAMRVAEADSTEDFTETISTLKEVSPNENTRMQNKRLRFDALTKTVELGRWYFPNCSEVLDKFLEEGSTDSAWFECGISEDQRIKRTRLFYELKEVLLKAYDKDKAAAAAITSTASSSSTPRWEMLTPGCGTSSQQATGAVTYSGNAPVLFPFGVSSQIPGNAGRTSSCQLEPQGSDAVVDNQVGVGSKTKLRSTVWNDIERVKIGNDWKGNCRRCETLLSISGKNGTSHLHRHLKSCRPAFKKKEKLSA